MRRALKNLIPTEVLERKKKAFIDQGPHRNIQQSRQVILDLMSSSRLVSSGFIDLRIFHHHLDLVANGKDTQAWPLLMRTVLFELWLKQ